LVSAPFPQLLDQLQIGKGLLAREILPRQILFDMQPMYEVVWLRYSAPNPVLQFWWIVMDKGFGKKKLQQQQQQQQQQKVRSVTRQKWK
jgi:hypothetical protein